ncbi:hypothetical protein J4477_04380 [Candidatus Pacearchaeota archaeon]|nr:hypothetical protein [Candidatus Pacearchaeota archaeon]
MRGVAIYLLGLSLLILLILSVVGALDPNAIGLGSAVPNNSYLSSRAQLNNSFIVLVDAPPGDGLSFDVELFINNTPNGVTNIPNQLATTTLIPNLTLAEGTNYSWYVAAVNISAWNATNLTNMKYFTLDLTYPTVSYNGWAANNVTNQSTFSILVDVTFNEIHFGNASFTLLNGTSREALHSTNVTSASSNTANFSGLSDGNYIVYVNATDLATNHNNTVVWRTVNIDSTYPLINFSDETFINNTDFTTEGAFVNVSMTEINFANFTFILTNVSSGIVLNTTYVNVSSATFINYTGLSDGNYSVNVTVTDVLNHQNITEYRLFNLNTAIPDSTAPVLSVSSSVATISQTQSVTLTCSAVDAIDSVPSVSLELKGPRDSDYATLSTGVSSISYVYSSTNILGTYTVKCTGSDATGNSDYTTTTFSVADVSSSGSSSGGSSGGSGSSVAVSRAAEVPVVEELVLIAEEQNDLESNSEWTENGVVSVSGLVSGDVYTFVTAADGESHLIDVDLVDELTGTVIVTIQSEPKTLTLTLENPIAEVDLNDDGTNDLRVVLFEIVDGGATLNFEKMDGLFEEPSQGLSVWIWVVAIVLILGVSAIIVYFVSKPKSKPKSRKK